MATGYRSLFGFWFGGLGSSGSAPTSTTGYRSLAGKWFGGLGSAGTPAPTVTGWRSRYAFWIGGIGSAGATPPTPTTRQTPAGRKRKHVNRPLVLPHQEDRIAELLGLKPAKRAELPKPIHAPQVYRQSAAEPEPIKPPEWLIAIIVERFQAFIAERDAEALLQQELQRKIAAENARNAELSALITQFWREDDDIAVLLLLSA